MNETLEMVKYILPTLAILITAYLVMKLYMENDQKKRTNDLMLASRRTVTPLRFQAYERIVLFLERITPSNLILRVAEAEMTATDLQATLVSTIRQEYEHNLSQQLYLSSQAWELVKTAKEDMIQLINASASRLNETASGTDLAKLIFEESIQQGTTPINMALEFIKKEIRLLF